MNQQQQYWGKTNHENYHLLQYHSLDVAAISYSILKNNHRKFNFIKKCFPKADDNSIYNYIAFFAAIHDIGKFSDGFQSKNINVYMKLHNDKPVLGEKLYHGAVGKVMWNDWLRDAIFGDIEYTMNNTLNKLIHASFGHHGKPIDTMKTNIIRCYTEEDKLAIEKFIHYISSKFNITHIVSEEIENVGTLSYVLSGLITIADWIASEYCPFIENNIPLDEYWKYSLIEAEKIITLPEINLIEPELCYNKKIFDFDVYTETQNYALNTQIDANTQHLYIIEDITGSGKTEAALLLAHNLECNGCGKGIAYALPSAASANMAWQRFKNNNIIEKLYTTSATMCITHGRKTELTTQLTTWRKENFRKKAFLNEFAIGTIDQLLMAILPNKHQTMRMFGLVGKILIIDEIHSYDAYTNELIRKLIEFHTKCGGSIILLTATLSDETKKSFVSAFNTSIQLQNNTEYPVITHITDASIEFHKCTHPIEKTIPVIQMYDENEIIQTVIDDIHNGKCVCWIRNTVNDAITLYDVFKQKNISDVILFHSRFLPRDRDCIENMVLKTFGSNSTAEQRYGKLLIATQVVEQALDIDFDVLISDAAPMDALIQRAGRLHRHKREYRTYQPKFILFTPEFTNEPKSNWYSDVFPTGKYVYKNTGYLWRTIKSLTETPYIILPTNVKKHIDNVFNTRDCPENLIYKENKHYEQNKKFGHIAELKSLNIDDGFIYTPVWNNYTSVTRYNGMLSINVFVIDDIIRVPYFSFKKIFIDYDKKNNYYLIDMSKVQYSSEYGLILKKNT